MSLTSRPRLSSCIVSFQCLISVPFKRMRRTFCPKKLSPFAWLFFYSGSSSYKAWALVTILHSLRTLDSANSEAAQHSPFAYQCNLLGMPIADCTFATLNIQCWIVDGRWTQNGIVHTKKELNDSELGNILWKIVSNNKNLCSEKFDLKLNSDQYIYIYIFF